MYVYDVLYYLLAKIIHLINRKSNESIFSDKIKKETFSLVILKFK